jgi:phage baseplate assembly protein W
MKDLIRTAILYFEPRVILDDVTFELVSAEGRIDLRVDYTIAKTNARNNFVYPFYLVEGSQVER